MKTRTTSNILLIITLFTLAAIITPYQAKGGPNTQEEDHYALMPEFCTAIFLTLGDQETADRWLSQYELDRVAIAFIQTNIETLLNEGEMRGEDITAASDGCKEAERAESAE